MAHVERDATHARRAGLVDVNAGGLAPVVLVVVTAVLPSRRAEQRGGQLFDPDGGRVAKVSPPTAMPELC